jgi:predicted ribosomally synthesized peptide with SipW-like signal peptide
MNTERAARCRRTPRRGSPPFGALQKGLLSVLVIGVLGGAVSLGVLAAFSATTQNSGNEITSGTVAVADNDNGSALYSVTGLKPGDTLSRCIKVTYQGSLPASLRLYSSGTPGQLAPYIDLTIAQGTQATPSFPDCSGFAADAGGALFAGTLEQFELNRTAYASGITLPPPSGSSWTQGASRVIRVDATLRAGTPDCAQGASSGVHSFVWEAHSD